MRMSGAGLRRVCPQCQATFFLCHQCDRWHCYCSTECRTKARKDSRKRSDRKYRQTDAWRRNNRKHQARHRQNRRLQKRVSEQSSASATPPVDPTPIINVASASTQKEHHASEPTSLGRPSPVLEHRPGPVRHGLCIVCKAVVGFITSPKGFPSLHERFRRRRRRP